MSGINAEGFLQGASDMEVDEADDHGQPQIWETQSAQEIPDSQPESQGLLIHNRAFPDEIPDSQDTLYIDFENLPADDLGHDYDFDYQADPDSHVLQDEDIDDQAAVQGTEDQVNNDFEDTFGELPQDTPQEGLQSFLYDHIYNYLGVPPNRRAEIPDSQESSNGPDYSAHIYQDNDNFQFDTDLDEEGPADAASSFCSVATEIIPGGTKLTPRQNPQAQLPEASYPLHQQGIACNGRLAIEAPQYRGQEMEEIATQPATQPQYDARRLGASSHLSKQDEADIIAILHPTSPAAHVAVNLTAQASPQHIWQNHNQSHVADDDETEIEDASMSKDNAQDIALRFSSRVNDVRMGFVFGRNVQSSDILLVRQERKAHVEQHGSTPTAISNKHFRIFVNRNGILMLEDTSTNGTIVDNIVLRGPKGQIESGDSQPRITLHSGVMIELPIRSNGESIRFIVNVPNRDQGESKYNENLNGYLAFLDQANRKARAVAAAQAGNRDVPVNVPLLTNALPAALQQPAALQRPAAPSGPVNFVAPGSNNHGLHWNGGEKYNVVGHIGAGAFATVCKLSSKRDGEVFAVKQLEKRRFLRNGMLTHKFHNELHLMMHASHPNIIEYMDHHETSTHLFIVMEYIPFGDLRHWTDYGKAMTEYMAARVGRQMLDAVTYLHEKGITHRDIKPDNILVAGDDPQDKIFKLTDFGLSKQVMDDQTFLQTFCGTPLYLAPEVYPGYDRVKAGLPPASKRTRGQAASTPYQHSVDIWSLGTVLYQLLAGKPPFTATQGDQGEFFLTTLMNVPVDYERLVYGGVTKDAINFISRMLVTDPQSRANETELSAHSWLIPKPYPAARRQPAVDVANDLDVGASQLSLADKNQNEEDMEDPRITKRFRGHNWGNDQDHDGRDDGDRMLPGGLPLSYFEPKRDEPSLRMSGPPPPRTESQLYPGRRPLPAPAKPERLFGEIGSSALRSSGVFGQNANLALGVSAEGVSSEEHNDGSFLEQLEQDFSDGASVGDTHVNTPRSNTVERVIQPQVQYPYIATNPQDTSAAPSLLGAEALVGQLNMTSPESEASALSTNSKPTTPKGTVGHDFSPGATTVKDPKHTIEPAANESDKKRSRMDNTPPSSHIQDPFVTASAQHRSSASEFGSKTSADNTRAGKGGSVADATSQKTSQHDDPEYHKGRQQKRDQGKKVTLHETTANSQRSSSTVSSKGSMKAAESHGNLSTRAFIQPSIDLAPPSGATADGFVKPPTRFGTLFIMKGSMKSLVCLKINSMGASFGRAINCTHQHPDAFDNRIPKNAFDIQMWYRGMEKDLEKGKSDWADNPNLTALISTRSTNGIKVNGVRLKKGDGCWAYGKLYTGDVVSVADYENEFLHYRCEFYIGASKLVRKEGDEFKIEKEDKIYQRHGGKKSRDGSVVSEEGYGENAAAGADDTEANTAANSKN